jgi:hypothetical protein
LLLSSFFCSILFFFSPLFFLTFFLPLRK